VRFAIYIALSIVDEFMTPDIATFTSTVILSPQIWPPLLRACREAGGSYLVDRSLRETSIMHTMLRD